MELEEFTNFTPPPVDRRKFMPEPPPVKLVAIEDVIAWTTAGLETKLDEFYVQMLRLERDARGDADLIAYRARNVRLVFKIVEKPAERPDFRPIGIEVLSIAIAEAAIVEREIEYERLRGLTAGQDSLLLKDPAGNWVSLNETREMR